MTTQISLCRRLYVIWCFMLLCGTPSHCIRYAVMVDAVTEPPTQRPHHECSSDEFTCGDGTCIPLSQRCDWTAYHCADGSDERDCRTYSSMLYCPAMCLCQCSDARDLVTGRVSGLLGYSMSNIVKTGWSFCLNRRQVFSDVVYLAHLPSSCSFRSILCRWFKNMRFLIMPYANTPAIVDVTVHFYPCDALHSAVFAVVQCLSTCLFACHTPILCLNGKTYFKTFWHSGSPIWVSV